LQGDLNNGDTQPAFTWKLTANTDPKRKKKRRSLDDLFWTPENAELLVPIEIKKRNPII
jgi:hypothetical protein